MMMIMMIMMMMIMIIMRCQVMRARSNVYHLECFACQECGHRFCVGDQFFLHDNKVMIVIVITIMIIIMIIIIIIIIITITIPWV